MDAQSTLIVQPELKIMLPEPLTLDEGQNRVWNPGHAKCSRSNAMPKIDGYDGTSQRADVRQVTRTTATRTTAGTTGSSPATTADTLQITTETQRLREGENRLRELPVTDTERVNRIRAAIADGSYQIDAARIAHKLMEFDAGLPDG